MRFLPFIIVFLLVGPCAFSEAAAGNVVTKIRVNELSVTASQLEQRLSRAQISEKINSSGVLNRYQSIQQGEALGFVQVNQNRSSWNVPGSNGQGDRRVIVSDQVRVYDRDVQGTMTIDFNSRSGKAFQATLQGIGGRVFDEALDFVAREQFLEQQRQLYQNFYQQAAEYNRQLVNDIRSQSAAYEQSAKESQNVGLANLGAGMAAALDSTGSYTMQEMRDRQNAYALSQSPLRNAEYEFNVEAKKLLEDQLRRAANEKRFEEMAELAEMLAQGKIDGKPASSKILGSYARADGVLKVGGTFDQSQFQTEARTQSGQVVRRMANRYQSLWAQSGGLSVLSSAEKARFAMGAMAVSLADGALYRADTGGDEESLRRGAGFIKFAQTMADTLIGFSSGIEQSIEELVKAVPELAVLTKNGVHRLFTDPEAAWNMTMEFVTQLPEMGSAILSSLAKDYKLLKNGNAFERGEVMGRYALDVISMVGTAGAGMAAKGATIGVRVSEMGAVVAKTIPASARVKAVEWVNTSRKLLESMPAPARAGFEKIANTNIKMAESLGGAYNEAIKRGYKPTAKYIEKWAAAETKIASPKIAREVAQFHSQAIERLESIKGISKEVTVSRGIDKTISKNGKLVNSTTADAFDLGFKNSRSNHRFTIGGDLGNSGIYVVEGTVANTKDTLIRETGKSASEIFIAEKKMNLQNLLDLTEANNIEKLGLDSIKLMGSDYTWTHAIGDAAREKGFSGIIFNSTKGDLINIVIFN